MARDINPWDGGDVSRDSQPDWLDDAVSEDLQGASLIGLDTAGVDESVLLIGPPGAGKTASMGQRLSVNAEQNGLGPRDVTAITYRRALAEELREKLVEWGVFPAPELPPTDPDAQYRYWGTVNAIASRATGFIDADQFAQHPSDHAGMVDEQAMRAFCREHDLRFNPSRPWFETRWTVFRSLYTFCKKNLIGIGTSQLPDEMMVVTPDDDANDPAKKAVAQHPRAWRLYKDFQAEWGDTRLTDVVNAWERWKANHDCHDFYEQIEAGITGDLPPTRVVVIDELHDAYPLMCLYFQRLIEHADTAIVAGDPLQICNQFSGATPELFNGLKDRIDADLPVVQLPRSHRVSDEAFAAASKVLSQYHEPPELETDGEGGLYRVEPAEKLRHDEQTGWSLPSVDSPGSPVALWDGLGTDVMLLARTQYLLDGIAAHLDRAGIVYESQQPTVAGNWQARLTLLRALNTMHGYRPGQQGSLTKEDEWEGDDTGDTKDVTRATQTALRPRDVIRLIRHVHEDYLAADRDEILSELRDFDREDDPVSLAELHKIVAGDGFWSVYGRGALSIDDLVRIDDHHGFTGDRQRDVTAMKLAWDRYAGTGYDGEDTTGPVKRLADGTKLLTIHAAKGNEAESVAVFSGITNATREAIEENRADAENEARTWYVALTRAVSDLYVVRDWTDATVGPYLPRDLVRSARHTARQQRQDDESGDDSAKASS